MKELQSLINELELSLIESDRSDPRISVSNVGWHIEHSLLVLNAITDALARSNPADFKKSFNFIRILVFTFGKIPRGKGKAPGSVIPTETINQASLLNHLERTKVKVMEIDKMESSCFFKHPFFGDLKLRQTIKFLQIHTKHHLDIINDIIKQNK
jgi:hypothetical protein